MEAGMNAVRRVAAKELLQLRLPLFVALLLGWFRFSPPWLVAAPSHQHSFLCDPAFVLVNFALGVFRIFRERRMACALAPPPLPTTSTAKSIVMALDLVPPPSRDKR
ncbi:hypothetical protein T484DRAFT_1819119 [Baffinella frigidus]|nr:hypothetical protein T484DRAFT_1819119 [Cryptophyta sp. CCMP2293]